MYYGNRIFHLYTVIHMQILHVNIKNISEICRFFILSNKFLFLVFLCKKKEKAIKCCVTILAYFIAFGL